MQAISLKRRIKTLGSPIGDETERSLYIYNSAEKLSFADVPAAKRTAPYPAVNPEATVAYTPIDGVFVEAVELVAATSVHAGATDPEYTLKLLAEFGVIVG